MITQTGSGPRTSVTLWREAFKQEDYSDYTADVVLFPGRIIDKSLVIIDQTTKS